MGIPKPGNFRKRITNGLVNCFGLSFLSPATPRWLLRSPFSRFFAPLGVSVMLHGAVGHYLTDASQRRNLLGGRADSASIGMKGAVYAKRGTAFGRLGHQAKIRSARLQRSPRKSSRNGNPFK